MKLLSWAPNLNRLCFHLRVEDTSPLDPTPAPVGNRTPAPGGGSSAEGINMPSAMEALQADKPAYLLGATALSSRSGPVIETSSSEAVRGQGRHNLPIALPRE